MVYKHLKISMIALLSWLLVACSHTTAPANVRAAGFNVQLGMAYLEQGERPRAKAKLLAALTQAPHWPPALDAMGYFLEKTGEPKEAQEYYLKAIKLAPLQGSVHNNYGAYLCRQGHIQAALQEFSYAFADKAYTEVASAYENAGLCVLDVPDKKLAAYYFQKALLHDPKRQSAAVELAKL